MYNVSSEFLEAIKQPARDFESKVIIRDKEYDDNVIIDMSQEEIVNPGDDFSLGSVASTKFEINLLEVEEIFENAEVKPYIGLNVDGVVEYVPLGVFTVDEVNKQNKKVKLTCFDNMIKMEKPYFSDLNYPATLQAIAEEISSKAGVIFNSTLPNHTIDKIEGYSLREAIGFIASACGGFARFNRLGQLEIKSYTDTDIVITGDNYFNFETADKEYKINKITAIKGEEQLSKGNVIEFGREVVFENPVITDSILTDIYNKLNGFSYMPYILKWQGNLALEAGDKVKIIDIKGNEYNTIVMQQKINYNGGLSAETKAVGKSEQANKFDSKGSITQRIERYSIEQANIRKALIEKANVVDLEAVNAKIENALIEKLDVIEFNSKIGIIETALIGKADIEDLTVLRGEFNTLKTVDFEAVKGGITNLTSSVADINTLLNGNLTSENMQAGAITATSGVIANGAITNAMIANIDAGKINTGFINTNNVTVKSEEGNLRIEGNTLKVWDSLGKERISLGKNDTDYNLLVRGKDGQTVLFGVDGVTNAGITEGAVDDSKVAPNANISGDKLNISSVVTKINEGTTKIESSHINYDGQSLNVAFGFLKTQVDETESKTNALITDFQIEQGRINTLISDVEIIESEVSSTKSNVSSLTQTVNSMKSSISSLQTENQTIKDDITGLSTEISTTQSNLALFKQDLDGFKTTVHDTYATKQSVTDIDGRVFSLNEKTTIMESNIAQNKTDIALKVSQTDVEKLISEIDIVGRNLLRYSSIGEYAGGNNRPTSNLTVDGSTIRVISQLFDLVGFTVPDVSNLSGTTLTLSLYTDLDSPITYYKFDNDIQKSKRLSLNNNRFEVQIDVPSGAKNLTIGIGMYPHPSVFEPYYLDRVKLEKGNKATDWTPAPEDIESEITAINTKVAGIDITLDDITSRVSSTESKIIKVNDEVSAIESRVSIAEQKITDDSIINTVRSSTAYKGDLDTITNQVTTVEQLANQLEINVKDYTDGKLSGATYTFDGNYATFKGAGLRIQNKLGQNVLQGDINGDLQLVGNFITYSNGNKALEMERQVLNFYDWEGTNREEPVGQIYSARKDGNADEPGIALGHNKKGYMALVYQGDDTYYSYIDFDKDNILGYSKDYPIIFWKDSLFKSSAMFEYMIYLGKRNKIFQSTKNALVLEVNDGSVERGFTLQGDTSGKVLDFRPWHKEEIMLWRTTKVNKDFLVAGSKNAVVNTKNYGERLINAYETAEYFFGDIGSGKIDESGLCYIYIDDIFQECVNTEIEYHVFLQKCGQGDVWIKEKHETYFIVEGTSGLNFSWELKAKRKGYEQHRLEQPDNLDFERDDSVSFNRDFEQEDKKDKELEKIYDDKLNFDLVNLLLKEVVQ